jgi:hypothetical protein
MVPGQATLVLRRIKALADFQTMEEFGCEKIKIECPVATPLTPAALRRVDVAQDLHAVELNPRKIRTEAPQRNATPFSRFAIDRNVPAGFAKIPPDSDRGTWPYLRR